MRPRITLTALSAIGEVRCGDDLGALIGDAIRLENLSVDERSIVVVAQKIVSKAEGRLVYLDGVRPSATAQQLADVTGKDPALVELILRESCAVLRACPNILIVRHRLGYVVANAGIDQSNVGDGSRRACLLLPEDPHASSLRIRDALRARLGTAPAIIVSDSFGRPWRRGVVNVALGSSGLPALVDRRGHLDRYGRPLQATEVAFADAVAAAAGLCMGEADEGIPAVLATGVEWSAPESSATALIRPLATDLFQ